MSMAIHLCENCSKTQEACNLQLHLHKFICSTQARKIILKLLCIF